jgi:hypothetical protein
MDIRPSLAFPKGGAVHRFVFALRGWARRDFVWGLLIVPLLLVMLIHGLSEANFRGWSNESAG